MNSTSLYISDFTLDWGLFCCCFLETADPEHGVQRGAAELLRPVHSIQHTTQLPKTTTQVHTQTHTLSIPCPVQTLTNLHPAQVHTLFVCSRRTWFGSTSSEVSISSSNSSVDMGDTAGGVGGVVERWSVFGPRPLVHKSTSDLGSDPSTAGKQRRLTVSH